MNEIKKSLLSVVLVVLLAVLGYFLYQNYDQAQNEKARQAAASPSPVAEATPTPTPTPNAVENVSLCACGDIVCHTGLNAEAENKDGTYDYAPIFSGVTPFVTKAD